MVLLKNGRHPTWTWKSPNGGINLALPVMFGGFTVIFLITALHDGILTPLLFVMLLSVHLFVGILAFSFYYPFTKPRTLYGTHLFIPQIGELRVQKAYMDANGNFILLTDSESVFLLGVCVDGLEKTLQNAGIAIQRVKWLCKGFCILIDTLGDEFLKHLDERLTKREYGELLKTIGDLNGWDLHTIGKRLLQKLEKTFPLGWFGLLWLLLILYTTGRLVLFLLRYDYALIEHLGLRFHLFPYSIELAVTFLIWGMFTSMVMILFLQP
ncbi:MAG: hypothetical protein GWO20_04075, partial [Candidatus Korarchaeota archaeon]|nr:hypothetical protein [Candidatus Korarchaeota archaeon]NIU83218.1 hypothetical protein [Candidatus Thorarchaeota archaeon]NIW13582.1 hypothetical protein [Candidatus Thorarchaeota archaeon]NIW51691.1 hypothetical protein [Candidatus Korarchaeota archaeon]